MGHNLYRG
uniref:Uncharacterized protein n=1 Tax=Arundo donax TaxID=35708 RepID=A0A0A8ZKP3_ARUDO